MAEYLFIASRDPFESEEVKHFYGLALGLAQESNTVTLFLVQNGVLPARTSSRSKLLTNLVASGVEVLADDFSLRERGIPTARLAEGVKPASLGVVIDQLALGRRALWN